MVDVPSARARMVEVDLVRRGIVDRPVLDAFETIRREAFVAADLEGHAYTDAPLPIGEGQTISQPYVVALTVQALGLRGDERVLEVGTGSGYAAAILSCVAKEVFTIERVAVLAASAEERLRRLGFDNVHVALGDGSLGLPAHGPYDAIAVAAGGPKAPPALLAQLAVGGRLVMPIGADETSQLLVRITRESETSYRHEPLTAVQFVPLIGEQAWAVSPDEVDPAATAGARR